MVYVASGRGLWHTKTTPEAVVSRRSAAISVKSFGSRGLDQPFKGNLGRLLFDSRPILIRIHFDSQGRFAVCDSAARGLDAREVESWD